MARNFWNTQAYTQHFRVVMHGVLIGMGAEPKGDLTYTKDADKGVPQKYVMNTAAGELDITLYNNWVAMRFCDMDNARRRFEGTPCFNKFSGKYNLQVFASVDYMVMLLKQMLDIVKA